MSSEDSVRHRQTDRYEDFVAWLKSLPREQIAQANLRDHEKAVREYNEFVAAFRKGECYLCNSPLRGFSVQTPCLHWLLKPDGSKKKHYPLMYAKYGFFQTQTYLRWVANQEAPFRNINDLTEEHSGKKKVDLTIRFGEFEWSFSCSDADFAGHAGALGGATPHYHLQMRVNGRPFIDYGEFHVPFSDEDLWNWHMTESYPDVFQHRFTFGEGMKDLLDVTDPEQLVHGVKPTDDMDQSTLHIQTVVMAEDGQEFKGEDIDALVKEAKEKGVTIASLIDKLGGKKMTIVEPGPGVPKPGERKGGRRSKPG